MSALISSLRLRWRLFRSRKYLTDDVDRACANCGYFEGEHTSFAGCDEFTEAA